MDMLTQVHLTYFKVTIVCGVLLFLRIGTKILHTQTKVLLQSKQDFNLAMVISVAAQ